MKRALVQSQGYFLVVLSRPLIAVASLVAEHGLQSAGFEALAPRHGESCRTRDRTCVPHTGRQILNKEVKELIFLNSNSRKHLMLNRTHLHIFKRHHLYLEKST